MHDIGVARSRYQIAELLLVSQVFTLRAVKIIDRRISRIVRDLYDPAAALIETIQDYIEHQYCDLPNLKNNMML
jgi:hypothetical protein